MVDWAQALQIFIVGFGGVLVTLLLLQGSINIFVRIIRRLGRFVKPS